MDFINSIKAHLYDKATSPLFGAFAASWVAFNYEFIFVLISSMPTHDRFEYISTFLYCDHTDYLFKGFLFPLASAVLILASYPIPARWAYIFWKSQQIKTKNKKLTLEGEALISKKKEGDIRREMEKAEIKHDKDIEGKEIKIKTLSDVTTELYEEIDERDNEIKSLKDHIEELKKSIPPEKTIRFPDETAPVDEINHHTSDVDADMEAYNATGLEKEQENILVELSKFSGRSQDQIIKLMSSHKQFTLYNIESLADNGYILSNNSGDYFITKEGRKLLVKAGYFKDTE